MEPDFPAGSRILMREATIDEVKAGQPVFLENDEGERTFKLLVEIVGEGDDRELRLGCTAKGFPVPPPVPLRRVRRLAVPRWRMVEVN